MSATTVLKSSTNQVRIHSLAFTIQSRHFADTIHTKRKEKINLNFQLKRLAKQKCNPQKLLKVFDQIQQEGIEYDHSSYLIAQKASIAMHCQNRNIRKAKHVWNEIITNELYKDKLEQQDYYTIISIFCNHQYSGTALAIFDEMRRDKNIKSKPKLYNVVITAAAKLKSLKKANEIYQILLENDPALIETDVFIQNGLINMFLSCRSLQSAQKIFESQHSQKTVETWNILMNGMIEDNKYEEAIRLFNDMTIHPNNFTYSCLAKAICKLKCVNEANKLYKMIQNDANMDIHKNIAVCNSLIRMFGRCGDIMQATEIFEFAFNHKRNCMDIITWNAMISIYFEEGNYGKVLDLYSQLMSIYRTRTRINSKNKIKPQIKTFIMFIEACADTEVSKQIYMDIRELFDVLRKPEVYRALIDMYCKCNGLEEGIVIWREMMQSEASVVKFTFMIRMCVEYGDNMKAFELFDEMQNVYNIKPDEAAFVTILRACGKYEALIKRMHEQIIEIGGEELCSNKNIAKTLITAYNVCGNKDMANQIWRG